MVFEASLILIILRGSLVVTVKSQETCRLETETIRTCPTVWRLCWRQTQLSLAGFIYYLLQVFPLTPNFHWIHLHWLLFKIKHSVLTTAHKSQKRDKHKLFCWTAEQNWIGAATQQTRIQWKLEVKDPRLGDSHL